MRRGLSKLARFVRLPIGEQGLTVVALLLIAAASATIAMLPFRRYARLFGQSLGAVGYVPLLGAVEMRRALSVRHAIGRAADAAPFRSNCLPQAMAAAVLARLLRFPLSVHLGIELADGMTAHAWSNAGAVAVSGGHGFARYTIVSCFCDRAGPALADEAGAMAPAHAAR